MTLRIFSFITGALLLVGLTGCGTIGNGAKSKQDANSAYWKKQHQQIERDSKRIGYAGKVKQKGLLARWFPKKNEEEFDASAFWQEKNPTIESDLTQFRDNMDMAKEERAARNAQLKKFFEEPPLPANAILD